MCGLGGFVGVPKDSRLALTLAIGIAIDKRGGHGSGYMTRRDDGKIVMGKTLNEWGRSSNAFIATAADGDLTMFHARFATCGKRTVEEAHPFAIKRDSRSKLWGMHNGIIYDAKESAKKHHRKPTVDSLEVLELLADGLYEEIEALEGYGTLVWVNDDARDTVRLVRMTASADLDIVKVKEGGFVYASTLEIATRAIEFAGLHVDFHYDLPVGVVHYLAAGDEHCRKTIEVVKLAERAKWGRWLLEEDDELLTSGGYGKWKGYGSYSYGGASKNNSVKGGGGSVHKFPSFLDTPNKGHRDDDTDPLIEVDLDDDDDLEGDYGDEALNRSFKAARYDLSDDEESAASEKDCLLCTMPDCPHPNEAKYHCGDCELNFWDCDEIGCGYEARELRDRRLLDTTGE
jgi:predicted glutamine amidotransferase